MAASVTVTDYVQRSEANTGVVHGLCIGAVVDTFVLNDLYFSTVGAAGPWTSTPVDTADPDYLWGGTGSPAGVAYRLPLALPENADGPIWFKVTTTHTAGPFGSHASLGLSLEAYWVCADNAASTVVVDSAGSRDGVASVNTDTIDIPGVLTGALDTTNQHIFLSAIEDNPGDVFAIGKPWSAAFWTMLPNTVGNRGILIATNNNGGGGGNGWNLFSFPAGAPMKLFLELRSGANTLAADSGAARLTHSIWQHVAITYDGTNGTAGSMNVYIQGANVGTSGLQANIGTITNSALIAGNQPNLVWDIDAKLCEMGIWSKELSVAEVGALFNGGVGLSY